MTIWALIQQRTYFVWYRLSFYQMKEYIRELSYTINILDNLSP